MMRVRQKPTRSGSSLEHGADGRHDVVAGRNGGELELVVVGHRDVARAETLDGRVQQVQPLLADHRRDLGAKAAALDRLVDDDEAIRLGDRGEDGVPCARVVLSLVFLPSCRQVLIVRSADLLDGRFARRAGGYEQGEHGQTAEAFHR